MYIYESLDVLLVLANKSQQDLDLRFPGPQVGDRRRVRPENTSLILEAGVRVSQHRTLTPSVVLTASKLLQKVGRLQAREAHPAAPVDEQQYLTPHRRSTTTTGISTRDWLRSMSASGQPQSQQKNPPKESQRREMSH